jgi:hypothetical protein
MHAGCITWPDGAMYLGQWYYEMITGKGDYISKLRDIYKGTMVNGLFDGLGELLYGDGAKYSGHFQMNRRHGSGIFIDSDGSEFYG